MEFQVASVDVLIVLIVLESWGLSVCHVVFDSVRFLCLFDQFLDEGQVLVKSRITRVFVSLVVCSVL